MATKAKKSKKEVIVIETDEDFSTDWDIDSYRNDYDSDEHWNLRRRFMESHKQNFPEDKLVCLTQVFFNMEFMGCKYPSETMHLVGELSQDVAKEFREKRASKLKRTFVAASSAAEDRAKAQQQQQHQKQQQQQNQKRKHFNTNDDEGAHRNAFALGKDLFKGMLFGKFVVYLHGGRNCLQLSSIRSKMALEEREVGPAGSQKKLEMYVNSKLVTSACEESIKASKLKAFQDGLIILQKNCYAIKPNPLRDTVQIEKSANKVVCKVTNEKSEVLLQEKKLDESNKGYKMMKMMGWSGGGLGSSTQGREEPVGYLLRQNRSGLGNESTVDRQYFTEMLRNYLDSEDIRELRFEPSFTKDERAMLHDIAGKLNLKSASNGTGEERRLVISKKTITNERILTEILLNANASYRDQYLVQVPETLASLYPDDAAPLSLN